MKKLVVYLIFLLFLVSFVSAQYSYSGRSFSIGNFDIIGFYYDYPYEIDFFIFLIIFLGLSKAVFKSKFKEQGKIIAIGIGIALSLAVVLWEYNNQRFLLSYGSIGVTILVLLVVFVIGWAFLKFILRAIFPKK